MVLEFAFKIADILFYTQSDVHKTTKIL